MLVQQDGDLQIAQGELVTVTVRAFGTHYLAIFGDLLHADWTIVDPLHQTATGVVQEVRSFVAAAPGTEAFAISCDFVRNTQSQPNPGASYQILLKGSGPLVIQKQILPLPPFPAVRPFVFEVRA
jgi:hypothetical protein